MKLKNKILIGILTLVMAVSALSLAACKKPSEQNALAFNSVINYSAIGGIGLLKAGENVTGATALTEAEKDEILTNLAIAEATLGGGVVQGEVKASDRAEYEFYYTVSAANASGGNDVYEFYYNETLRELDFDESEYTLRGVVILDGVEYDVIGERETEGDEEEFSFRVSLSEGDYVVIEQESERDEKEFSYTLYKGGRKVYETEVEYEKNLLGKVELSFKINDGGAKQKYKYEFYDALGTSYVRVKLSASGKETVVAVVKIVTNEDGLRSYEFVNDGAATQKV